MPVEERRFLFGTIIRITAYGPGATAAVGEAMEEMARIHRWASQTQGIVARINAQAGKTPVQVGPEIVAFLQKVFQLAEACGGYFNPVIGALVEIWDFGYEGKGRIPSAAEIRQVLPLIDRQKVVIDEKAQTVFLQEPGMKIDLSGVVKGYAIDRAWEILKIKKVTGALIDGGESSIRVLGERPGGGPWRIAVSHPRQSEWIGIIQLTSSQALGTSADTEHYLESEGRRFSHLLNPFTGYPPEDLLAVTIVADSALKADLYSTAVFVAAADDREGLVTGQGLEVLLVDSQSQVHMTPGLAAKLNPETLD
jgi:thiamine biosynthesis lipoprotein